MPWSCAWRASAEAAQPQLTARPTARQWSGQRPATIHLNCGPAAGEGSAQQMGLWPVPQAAPQGWCRSRCVRTRASDRSMRALSSTNHRYISTVNPCVPAVPDHFKIHSRREPATMPWSCASRSSTAAAQPQLTARPTARKWSDRRHAKITTDCGPAAKKWSAQQLRVIY